LQIAMVEEKFAGISWHFRYLDTFARDVIGINGDEFISGRDVIIYTFSGVSDSYFSLT